jgi:tellurite methyltransferase
MKNNLQEAFGNIDIYLFDQLLKGRFDSCKTILDAGCGHGRNLVYFLQHNFEVFGIDQDAGAIEEVRRLSTRLAPAIPKTNFMVSKVEDISFADSSFDVIISSAVLHFAKDRDHFDSMLKSMWRVLRPGGFLFARLASDIGIEHLVRSLGQGRYLLPDGSERFLVNEQILLNCTRELNGDLYEHIKTTNVQNYRCMTTWCLQKR